MGDGGVLDEAQNWGSRPALPASVILRSCFRPLSSACLCVVEKKTLPCDPSRPSTMVQANWSGLDALARQKLASVSLWPSFCADGPVSFLWVEATAALRPGTVALCRDPLLWLSGHEQNFLRLVSHVFDFFVLLFLISFRLLHTEPRNDSVKYTPTGCNQETLSRSSFVTRHLEGLLEGYSLASPSAHEVRFSAPH